MKRLGSEMNLRTSHGDGRDWHLMDYPLRTTLLDDESVAIEPPSDARGMRWMASLSAAAIPYQARLAGDSVSIVVGFDQAAAAVAEIREYEAVNRDWPPPSSPVTGEVDDISILAAILAVGLLTVAFYKTGPVHGDHFVALTAVLDSLLVREFEFWRLTTALGLHVDAMHLFANGVCLLVFGAVAGAQIGFGASWLAILCGGTLGNGLAVFFSREPFQAVGASTAVFAALGILVVLRFSTLHRDRRGVGRRSIWERRWLPWFAGAGALALLGGDPGSHLAGHLFGFLAGLVVAPAILPLRRLKSITLLQLALYAIFLALNAWAWSCATVA